MNYETQIEQLLEAFDKDYAVWNEKAGCNSLEPPKFMIESGRTYDKIIKVDDRSYSTQKCVIGFVVRKDTKKGFLKGDILKAAGYNAPATNFSRGNIFNLEKAVAQGAIRWAGVC